MRISDTALLHDIGRSGDAEHHVEQGAILARRILVACGFSEKEADAVAYAILHHHDLQETDELSVLLYLADKKSRLCFDCASYEECCWDSLLKNHALTI